MRLMARWTVERTAEKSSAISMCGVMDGTTNAELHLAVEDLIDDVFRIGQRTVPGGRVWSRPGWPPPGRRLGLA